MMFQYYIDRLRSIERRDICQWQTWKKSFLVHLRHGSTKRCSRAVVRILSLPR